MLSRRAHSISMSWKPSHFPHIFIHLVIFLPLFLTRFYYLNKHQLMSFSQLQGNIWILILIYMIIYRLSMYSTQSYQTYLYTSKCLLRNERVCVVIYIYHENHYWQSEMQERTQAMGIIWSFESILFFQGNSPLGQEQHVKAIYCEACLYSEQLLLLPHLRVKFFFFWLNPLLIRQHQRVFISYRWEYRTWYLFLYEFYGPFMCEAGRLNIS